MNEDNINNDEYIEIDLKEYLYILWKNKILIISIIVISIFLSYTYSTLLVDPVYQSQATILTPNFELINNETFNSSEYINLLKSNEIGNKIKNNYYNSEKYNTIVLDDIYNKIVIDSNGDNRNINLTLKDKEPDRAKNILTFWINEFIKNVENDIDNVNNNYINNYKDRLNEQYNEYTKALRKYTAFKQENNLNLLNNQLSSKENRLVDLEIQILDIKNLINNNNAELIIVKNQLENTDKFFVQKEKISDETLRKINAINNNSSLANLLTSENEILNPQYNSLINKKNNLEQQLKSLETKYKDYTSEIKNLRPEINNLQGEINNLNEEETLLKNELENLEETYNNILIKYNELEDKLIQYDKNIIILNAANTPNYASNNNLKLNLAIAFVLGLFLAIFIVFIKEFLKGTDWNEYEKN